VCRLGRRDKKGELEHEVPVNGRDKEIKLQRKEGNNKM